MQVINAKTAKQMLKENNAVIIDVREQQEFIQEHIDGSVNIPLSIISEDLIKSLSKDKKLIVSCLSGARAQNACGKIKSLQTENVFILNHGIKEWKTEKFETIMGGKNTISIMRQVLIAAGSLVVLGNLAGFGISSLFHALSLFVGLGLSFAGITGICPMAKVLQKMPWNK